MERQHGPAAGNEGTNHTQREQARSEVSANVQVNYVIAKPRQKANDLDGARRIVHFVRIGFSMSR